MIGLNGCIRLSVRVDCALLSVVLSLMHILLILSGLGCGSKVELEQLRDCRTDLAGD